MTQTADYTSGQDEETMAEEDETANGADLKAAVAVYEKWNATAPDNADYGIWIPGIPAFAWSLLLMQQIVQTG